jgi:diguanylate cyclase (GGDEF)-like protein
MKYLCQIIAFLYSLCYSKYMLKELAPKPGSLAPAAIGGLVVGYLARGVRSRRQLRRAESENERLRHEVAHDELTGLLTKKAMVERGNQRLARAKPDQVFALVFFDLDNFKAINDKHPDNYDEGDRILKGSASVLARNIRRGDGADILAHGSREDSEAARLGGDEFAGLFELTARNEVGEAMTNEERAAALSDRVRADFKEEFAGRPDLEALGGVDLSVVAIIREPGETMESMLTRGAAAMHPQKQQHHQENGAYRS